MQSYSPLVTNMGCQLTASLQFDQLLCCHNADAISGASHVTVTDRSHVLPFLRANVEQNLADNDELKSRVRIAELDWLTAETNELWNEEFDVILGADLVYDRELFEPLSDMLHHWGTKINHAYLAARIRYPKDSAFFDDLDKYMFTDVLFEDPGCDTNKIYEINHYGCIEL